MDKEEITLGESVTFLAGLGLVGIAAYYGFFSSADDSGATALGAMSYLPYVMGAYYFFKSRRLEKIVKEAQSESVVQSYDKPASTGYADDWHRVFIEYINEKGDVSEREVEFKKDNGETFFAYCRKRRAIRTFRYDRIQNDAVVNTSTGERISPEEWKRQTS